MIAFWQTAKVHFNCTDAAGKDFRAFVQRPYFLCICGGCAVAILLLGRCTNLAPDYRRRWRARLPQVLHAQQVLDVIVEQLVEQFLRIVIDTGCPSSRTSPLHVAPVIDFRRDGRFSGIGYRFGVFGVWRHLMIGIVFSKELTKHN